MHRFITDVVAMKGTNTYIFEGLFGFFHGKSTFVHKINVAKEVTNNVAAQVLQVKTKNQKLVKCCHVWLALYKKALKDGKRPKVPVVTVNEENPTDDTKVEQKKETSDVVGEREKRKDRDPLPEKEKRAKKKMG